MGKTNDPNHQGRFSQPPALRGAVPGAVQNAMVLVLISLVILFFADHVRFWPPIHTAEKKMFLNLFFYLGPMPVQFSMKNSEQAHPSGQAKPHLWCRASSPSTERATRDSKYAKQTIDP